MRICVVASSRFPVAEPFAGGLEAHTAALVRELRRRGHDVELFAAPGSSPDLGARHLAVAPFASSPAARADLAAPPETWMQEHHAYLDLMLMLGNDGRDGGRRFDLVHNNSLHHLPIAMAPALSVPVVTTLHTPPVPWLESAMALALDRSGPRCHFIAVSERTRQQWSHCVDARVVHNGVDLERWPAGPGGPRAIWAGRLVPEKAPHHALLAARRAGIPIDLVGPVGDRAYVEEHVWPLLDDDHRYLGHLHQAALARAVGRAGVAVVTPVWEEPFGLVAAEAMCSGTPVAAYARGALPEVVGPDTGRLAPPDDTDALAAAMLEARGLDRARVRAVAGAAYGLEAMVDAYEEVYGRAVGELGRVA